MKWPYSFVPKIAEMPRTAFRAASFMEPGILTKKTLSTYYKDKSCNVGYIKDVAEYFAALGLRVTKEPNRVRGENDTLVAEFSYFKQDLSVEKTLTVLCLENGGWKKASILELRKLHKRAHAKRLLLENPGENWLQVSLMVGTEVLEILEEIGNEHPNGW